MGRHFPESTAPIGARAAESFLRSGVIVPGDLHDRVIQALKKGELEIVYQPAIRLDAPRVEFFEALTRFDSSSSETPDAWFTAAAELGLGAELEMLAVKCAIEGFGALPDGSAMSINVAPDTILSAVFAEQLASAPVDRLVLEITEKQPVTSYEAIVEALEPLRARGLRIAVDDAGAGYSSFRHILQIRPDIIKLDMSVCRGVHQDHMRRALVSALVAFSRQTGSALVAEGIETASELMSLRALGVTIIQGHIVGRPMSPQRLNAGAPKTSFPQDAVPRRISKAA